MGTKDELVRRMVAHLASINDLTISDDEDGEDSAGKPKHATATAPTPGTLLISAIMANKGYDAAALLSLGGSVINPTSSPKEAKRAYLKICRKVHPDKNRGNPDAKAAFQLLVEALEQHSNPDGPEDSDARHARKRAKPSRVERSNKGCFKTKVSCPRCFMEWGKAEAGLEKGAYNFLMMGIKQYVCGRCAMRFGCVTALHTCPLCRGPYLGYDPSDYHRQVNCGCGAHKQSRCVTAGATFGFHYASVSVRREEEVRKEAKREAEARLKRRNAAKRRDARASGHANRTRTDFSSSSGSSGGGRGGTAALSLSPQEQLFCEGLVDTCPRCGGDGGIRTSAGLKTRRELAEAHLAGCTDAAAHGAHAKRVTAARAKRERKLEGEEAQGEAAALASWTFAGQSLFVPLHTSTVRANPAHNDLTLTRSPHIHA